MHIKIVYYQDRYKGGKSVFIFHYLNVFFTTTYSYSNNKNNSNFKYNNIKIVSSN